MSDDDAVGYRKPPKQSRFRPGVSGNPKGRPKRKPMELAAIIRDVLGARIQYREQGHIKGAPRQEVVLKKLIERAVKGHIEAADLVLRVRARAQRFGNADVERLEVSGWLPDYPGQTAEQKSRDFAGMAGAAPETPDRANSTDAEP